MKKAAFPHGHMTKGRRSLSGLLAAGLNTASSPLQSDIKPIGLDASFFSDVA